MSHSKPIPRRRFIAISAAALLSPGAAMGAAGIVYWSGTALGAAASLAISGTSRSRAEELITLARAEIDRLENIFSLYRENSMLMKLNRTGLLDTPPLDLLHLLSLAGAVHDATDGAFDPTVQPLWALYAENGGKPDKPALHDALSRTGWRHVITEPQRVSFARPDMAMTLNGIAQGYVTDRIADLLRSKGLQNVLVSVGEISAIGERSPGVHWQVGLAELGNQAAEETIDLHDNAVATSAPLGTVMDPAGRIGHIIDPRSGSVDSKWRRVSVIHKSAAIADGLSTAFAVMDDDTIRHALRQVGEARVIAVDREGRRFFQA